MVIGSVVNLLHHDGSYMGRVTLVDTDLLGHIRIHTPEFQGITALGRASRYSEDGFTCLNDDLKLSFLNGSLES